jgi:hypothetical protein
MKIKAFASTLALFMLSFAASQSIFAQSASGAYQFTFEDGYTKYVEFDARSLSDGKAVGQMTLSDEATLYTQDVDGTGETEEKHAGFYIKADFDAMVVDKNRAVMSGIIGDASIRELIGQRVLLTVEDNGDNTRVPDKLTWGIYKKVDKGWTPSDAERKEDEGVGLRWIATDAERKDDQGIAMPRSEEITHESFPLASYGFADVSSAAGDIRVQSL